MKIYKNHFMLDMGVSAIAIIVLFLIVAACIPEIPAPVVEVVNECYVPELIPKSKLPTVKYIIVDEYKCFADSEQEENAKKREAFLKMDSNNCRDQYEDVRLRCNPEGE